VTYRFTYILSHMVKISDLGDSLGAPPLKVERICAGHGYHYAKFHSDGVTAAEISVTRQRKTAANIPLHTNV